MNTNPEMRKKVREFLEEFGESVDEIRHDNVPVWWFIKNDFLNDILYSVFPRHNEIIDSAISGRVTGPGERALKDSKLYLLKKLFYFNERSKILLSGLNRKRIEPVKNADNVMFLASTPSVYVDNNGDYQFMRLESVINAVEEDHELNGTIFTVDPLSANSKLNYRGLPNPVNAYMDRAVRKTASRSSRDLGNMWKEMRGTLELDSELDKKFFDQFMPTLDFYFARESIYVPVIYYEAYKRIIGANDIRVLCIDACSRMMMRCAIAAANASGINTLHIYHGLGKIPINPELPQSVYYAVPGEYFREGLAEIGINPRNVRVTGPVFMDKLPEYNKKDDSKAGMKQVMVVTTSIVDDQFIEADAYFGAVRKYMESLSKVRDARIVIKLHPRDKQTDAYRGIIESLKAEEKIRIELDPKKQALYDLIGGSDVVVTLFSSTVTIEAMLIDVPTVTIDMIEFKDPDIILDNRTEILHLGDDVDLGDLVDKLIHDEEYRAEVISRGRRFTERYLYKVDGNSGKRTSEEIKELAKKSQPR